MSCVCVCMCVVCVCVCVCCVCAAKLGYCADQNISQTLKRKMESYHTTSCVTSVSSTALLLVTDTPTSKLRPYSTHHLHTGHTGRGPPTQTMYCRCFVTRGALPKVTKWWTNMGGIYKGWTKETTSYICTYTTVGLTHHRQVVHTLTLNGRGPPWFVNMMYRTYTYIVFIDTLPIK